MRLALASVWPVANIYCRGVADVLRSAKSEPLNECSGIIVQIALELLNHKGPL